MPPEEYASGTAFILLSLPPRRRKLVEMFQQCLADSIEQFMVLASLVPYISQPDYECHSFTDTPVSWLPEERIGTFLAVSILILAE